MGREGRNSEVRVAGDEAGTDAEFVGSETHGLFRRGLRDTTDFEKHVARTDDCHPTFDSAFAFTHPGFRRT